MENATNNDTNNDTSTSTAPAFQWPTDPPQDWFEAKGAALGLSPDTIRFAAALHSLGGADSKKNTQAARLAGVALDRVRAFRQARSVSVRKLLDEAKRLRAGNLPPLTEADIDREIDDLIRQPDALTKARGIELREKRKSRQAELTRHRPEESAEEQMAAIICSVPESGLGAFLAMSCFRSSTGNLVNFPFLAECLPIVSQNFASEYQKWRAKENAKWVHDFLDQQAAGPLLEGDQLSAAVKRKVPVFGRAQPTAEADNG
jgi:hypothetical protein